jgi:aspartate racemase
MKRVIALAAVFAILALAGCASAPAGAQAQNATAAKNMKVIGIIGGVSWHSTSDYYRIINERIGAELGDPHSAKILMYSIDFGEVANHVKMADKGDMKLVGRVLVDAVQRLERGGADFIVVASNTMNAFNGEIVSGTGIPVLSIVDATGESVKKSGIKKVILLGSKIVTEQDYYKGTLERKYNLAVVLPNATERDYLNSVIFDELCVGNISSQSRDGVVAIVERLVKEQGADGVILGCTELPLLIKQNDVSVPVFDTTQIHAEAAADYALGKR